MFIYYYSDELGRAWDSGKQQMSITKSCITYFQDAIAIAIAPRPSL
jgi:hypothetical protein